MIFPMPKALSSGQIKSTPPTNTIDVYAYLYTAAAVFVQSAQTKLRLKHKKFDTAVSNISGPTTHAFIVDSKVPIVGTN